MAHSQDWKVNDDCNDNTSIHEWRLLKIKDCDVTAIKGHVNKVTKNQDHYIVLKLIPRCLRFTCKPLKS